MMTIVETERAKRLARAIASDLSLYNDAKINRAIETDSLFTDLSTEFEEGQTLYRARVSSDLDPHAHFFWHAIVDALLTSRGHISSLIW